VPAKRDPVHGQMAAVPAIDRERNAQVVGCFGGRVGDFGGVPTGHLGAACPQGAPESVDLVGQAGVLEAAGETVYGGGAEFGVVDVIERGEGLVSGAGRRGPRRRGRQRRAGSVAWPVRLRWGARTRRPAACGPGTGGRVCGRGARGSAVGRGGGRRRGRRRRAAPHGTGPHGTGPHGTGPHGTGPRPGGCGAPRRRTPSGGA